MLKSLAALCLCFTLLSAQSRYVLTVYPKTCFSPSVYLTVSNRPSNDSLLTEWSQGEKNVLGLNSPETGLHLVAIKHIWYSGNTRHQFDTVMVFKIIDLGCNIQPPSFFSPNSDGINDLLIIKNIEHFPEFKLELYNQNGNRVMKQENTYEPWNGQYLNADVPIGDYILVFYKNKSVSNHANSYPLKLLR